MPKLVYDFAEGNKSMKQLLGGKGANLAEMTNLGLPVARYARQASAPVSYTHLTLPTTERV